MISLLGGLRHVRQQAVADKTVAIIACDAKCANARGCMVMRATGSRELPVATEWHASGLDQMRARAGPVQAPTSERPTLCVLVSTQHG
jgi:hypothetical protein